MIILACDIPGCVVTECVKDKDASIPKGWNTLPMALNTSERHVCPVHVRELEEAKNRILDGVTP